MRERKLEVDFERRLDEEAAAARRRRPHRPAILAVLALSAAAGLSCLAFGGGGKDPVSDVVLVRTQVDAVRAAVEEVYAGEAGTGGLDAAMIVDSGRLPRAMVSAAGISHALGGAIDLASSDGGWTLAVRGLPPWACAMLASGRQPVQSVGVSVGEASSREGPMDPKVAARACASADAGTVRWDFR